ncbi:MAG: hypothetical protein JRE01_10345 [Deltaproteobacteria bacterium]|nr:hypothetical protein [Deltaproteobacteria bacterium]
MNYPMVEESKTFQLIARQGSAANPGLERLLRVLMNDHGLDAYSARTRLTGSGKALLGSGNREAVERLAALLRDHGYDCWVIQRTDQTAPPLRLRELVVKPDVVDLVCRERTVPLCRGASVVAVLADISGKLEERALKRHTIQRQYKDSRHVTSMVNEKMVESVLKGTPVLDLYLLDDQNRPIDAVRVLPARFNAKGLGDRMTLSATRNIQAIVELCKEYAGHFSLHADFGLGRLPGCQIKSLDGQFLHPDATLQRLTRYGWLMCDLEQDRPEAADDDIAPALAAVAAAAGRPALAAAIASGNAEATPGLGEVVKEIKTGDLPGEEAGSDASAEQWLPSPPDRPAKKISLGMVASVLGSILLAASFAFLEVGNIDVFRTAGRYATKAGLFPALASAGLFWAGFYFIRLKRRVENTPTSRIRSIAMGLVEVHGRVLRKYALVAPMSESPCVYYRVRKYRKDRRNQWKLSSDINSKHVPFLLDDGTGMVTVDPRSATVKARVSHSGVPGDATLAFHGVSLSEGDINEKWVENVIYEGTTVYVLGFARPLRQERKSLRERTTEKLRDLKLDRSALHRYDTDGDGRISEGEWDVARGDAEHVALRERLAEGAGGRRQQEHVVITRAPQRGTPFVIAETPSEAELTRNYWLISIPLLLAGLCAAGLALYGLLKFVGA